jgi:hypothetical protein
VIVFGAHRDVRLELLPHLVVGRSPAEPAIHYAHRSTLRTPSVSVAQLASISFSRFRPAGVSRYTRARRPFGVTVHSASMKPDLSRRWSAG